MVEINFLGSCREVGRAAVFLEAEKENLLLDYGINVQTLDVPLEPKKPVDAVVISHAHLDHSGNVPALYRKGYNKNVYALPATFALCDLLLKDSIKVMKLKGIEPFFNAQDIQKMQSRSKNAGFNKKIRLDSGMLEFFDAGHVPGSASILAETGGKRILYTGDIKFEETRLMKKAFTDFRDIDAVICESTYSYKDHPDRKKLEDTLKKMIQNTIYNNGIVLLPCFAVGRTQELLLIVSELGFPVYMDGMGLDATRIILQKRKSVKDFKKLQKAFSQVRKIRRAKQRKNVFESPCIVIATAGMLNGGPINYYIKRLYSREDCTMILSGFQVPGTVGRTLLDTGRYIYGDIDVKPKMRIEFLDFSAHCGRSGIIKFLKKTSPEKVFLVHGERTQEFAEELKETGFNAFAPKRGERHML